MKVNVVFFVAFFILSFCLISCHSSDKRPGVGISPDKEVVNIIFDTDIGPDYDDAGALAMLHALADRGEANILATIASNKHELVAPVIDIINTYYGRPDLPIGAPKGMGGVDITSKYRWAEEIADQYPHDVQSTSAVPDAVSVYRRLLVEQPDTSVTVVTVGFLTNLANLLQSKPDSLSPLNGRDLVRKKVKMLVSMAGKFPEGEEFNVQMDSAAGQYLATRWPSPVIFSGFEVGEKVLTGAELVQKESRGNPVQHIYRVALKKEKAENRMSWDQTAVLIAVQGFEDYYDLKRGKIQVKDDGSNRWQDDPQGNHYYVIEKMEVPAVRSTIEAFMMHEPE